MTKVQFGLVVPGDALERSKRHRYLEDVNRLLTTVKGSYHSAWFIDHLQFPRDAQRVCSVKSNGHERVLHGSHVGLRQNHGP